MWNRPRGEEGGQSTVLAAIFLCFLAIGFLAIGIDVANLFYAKRRVQSAADAAVLAAAQQDYVDNSGNIATPADDVYTAAYQAMANNQISPYDAQYPATVKLNNPPLQGTYSTGTYASNYIEAVVSKPFATFFLSYFNTQWAHIAVTARAVAGFSTNSPQCLCTTGTSGTGLLASGTGSVTFSGCSATVDSTSSNAVMASSGTISGAGLNIVSSSWTEYNSAQSWLSNVTGNGSISVSHLSTGASSCSAKSITAPTVPSSCVSDPVGYSKGYIGTYSLGPTDPSTPICYTGGLVVGANQNTAILNPGIYVINGGNVEFVAGGFSKGSGIFFYLTNGATLSIDNGANVNLTAMSSGQYEGIFVYEDPSDTNAITLGGGATSVITGDIIAPSATLTDANNENMTVNGDIVVKNLVATGSGKLTINANSITGGSTQQPPRLVE